MPANDHLGMQFDKAMQIINNSPGLIVGNDARTVMKAAGIRSWPVKDHPEAYSGGSGEDPGSVSDMETLHTRQAHLHGPTMRRFMAGDVPEFDPEHAPHDVEYRPEITTHKDRSWIQEGHHRIAASRLRGDGSIDTWNSYSSTPWGR